MNQMSNLLGRNFSINDSMFVDPRVRHCYSFDQSRNEVGCLQDHVVGQVCLVFTLWWGILSLCVSVVCSSRVSRASGGCAEVRVTTTSGQVGVHHWPPQLRDTLPRHNVTANHS